MFFFCLDAVRFPEQMRSHWRRLKPTSTACNCLTTYCWEFINTTTKHKLDDFKLFCPLGILFWKNFSLFKQTLAWLYHQEKFLYCKYTPGLEIWDLVNLSFLLHNINDYQVVFVPFKICQWLTRPSQGAGLVERKYTPPDTAWPE